MKNKLVALIIVLTLLVGMVSLDYAYGNDFYAQYNGITTTNMGYSPNCTFTIIDINDGRFRGTFSASNIDPYNFNVPVEGTVYNGNNEFTCVFYFKFNVIYHSNMVITVNPTKGECRCVCEGSWHMEDFVMKGTKFKYNSLNGSINGNAAYNEDDMVMCAVLSSRVYNLNKLLKSHDLFGEKSEFGISRSNLRIYNYGLDASDKNVAFVIFQKQDPKDKNRVQMIVAIRGTYHDEWQGNVKVTGDEFNSNCTTHYNFNAAKDSIKHKIKLHYDLLKVSYEKVDLIITGHSRGAAVANLYAKEATDRINGVSNKSIPNFYSVTAYTFATPNVAKYNSYMENYDNIFNFCFAEDLVTTVPLTKPINGWNYWKYGKTFVTSLLDKNTYSKIKSNSKSISSNCISDIHYDFKKWESVNDYYNKKIPGKSLDTGEIIEYATLYQFACDGTGVLRPHSAIRLLSSLNGFVKRFALYDDFMPLIVDGLRYKDSISGAHHFQTYEQTLLTFGSSIFTNIQYSNIVKNNNAKNKYLSRSNKTRICFDENQKIK